MSGRCIFWALVLSALLWFGFGLLAYMVWEAIT